MSRELDNAVRKAISAGLLPAGAAASPEWSRPWPVVLLTGVGAWFAALPVLAFIYFAFYGALTDGASLYILGALMLGGAVATLRLSGLSLFVEQLALPGGLAGAGMIAFRLYRDLSSSSASIVLALLAGLIAALVARNWLRTLMGASACCLMVSAFASRMGQHEREALAFVHVLLTVWLPLHWLASSHPSARLDSFSTGWVLAILGWLAMLSGSPFLLGASGAWVAEVAEPVPALASPALASLISTAAAAGGAGWIAFCWPATRKIPFAMAAMVLIGLAAVMPALGATLLVLSALLIAGRWGLATAAGFTAAWIVGAFYYQLHFPLATKALLMVAVGAVLGAIAWHLMRRRDPAAEIDSNSYLYAISLRRQSGIVISAIAVLATVNVGIWQKEAQIANGHIIFIALAPVDPRSLMQGDYMRLNFSTLSPADADIPAEKTPPKAVAKVGARGIATLPRLHSGERLGPDELLIELVDRHGRLTLGADAWYFKEGESARWAAAKYGEFRVDDDGHATLVGMRGAALEAL